MKQVKPLDFKQLRQKLKANELDFETTAELQSLTEFIGQKRAIEAISLGISIKKHGYNLYAMGPAGIGKRTLVRTILKKRARKQKVPSDWCYIHNFDIPDKPIAIELPPGIGVRLQADMEDFIDDVGHSILAIFEGDEYRKRVERIERELKTKLKNSVNANETSRDDIPHSAPLYKQRREKEGLLQIKYVTAIIKPTIRRLKSRYAHFPKILDYLNIVQNDILNNIPEFVKVDEKTQLPYFAYDNPELVKYRVNLFVDNSKRKGAPILFANNPAYSNLTGRIEYVRQFGTLVTNFTLIKSGSLHRANGGYLIIEARKLMNARFAWEGLKRALYSHKIKIESPDNLSDTVRQVSIDPMSIPLNIKIILLGERHTFYCLLHEDSDFAELFKVAVDFQEIIDRNKSNIQLYSRLIATIIKREHLRPFHANAVAAVIDHSTRLAEDIKKMSTHVRDIDDLLIESNYWAHMANRAIVKAVDVTKAIDAQIYRIDRSREIYFEDINRKFILINTTGLAVGQLNALSVVRVGNYAYGHPTRLTAKVHMGKSKLIDIQREIKLAGPMLTKGSLTIANYLASKYNLEYPYSVTASISFEQVYGTIDGDSAAIAELCALLSALSQLPIKQNLAITGSMNQYGEAQVIGGVNEKIEGFFSICKARGLTGSQGVIIPLINVKNLMLREEVVQAAKDKKFFIYTVESVDEAIALLTGVPVGKRQKNGSFEPGTVNYLVEEQLKIFSQRYARKSKA